MRMNLILIIQSGERIRQETLESFNEDLAQQLLIAILPATGHSVVVAMRPKGGKVLVSGGEGLDNSEISWGKWGETMRNQVKPEKMGDFKGLNSERIWDSIGSNRRWTNSMSENAARRWCCPNPVWSVKKSICVFSSVKETELIVSTRPTLYSRFN